MNEFKGFSLFNDIEDEGLRNRNRAVVMANMASNHNKNGRITAGAAGLILGYFSALSVPDRKAVMPGFLEQMKERGFRFEL